MVEIGRVDVYKEVIKSLKHRLESLKHQLEECRKDKKEIEMMISEFCEKAGWIPNS